LCAFCLESTKRCTKINILQTNQQNKISTHYSFANAIEMRIANSVLGNKSEISAKFNKNLEMLQRNDFRVNRECKDAQS
jgi:hypothetical protein